MRPGPPPTSPTTPSAEPYGTARGGGRAMAAPSAPAEGGLVAGRYRLGQLLGRGSSAAVYAAEDERLHRAVTVKLIDAEVARDPDLRQRFQPRFTSGREHLQVTVSSGVTVPDVRGKSIPEATKTLQDLGWRVGRVDRGSHSDQKSGTIALQYPAPGQVLPEPGEILLAVTE